MTRSPFCPRCGSRVPPVETIVETDLVVLSELRCGRCGFYVVGSSDDDLIEEGST